MIPTIGEEEHGGLRQQLSRFSMALGHALYDTIAETEREVRYYYDSDVVSQIVLGLDAPKQSGEVSQRERLHWSLLSAGYLGEIFVLRPHLLEVDRTVRRFGFEEKNVEDFPNRLKIFLQEQGLLDNVSLLLEEISSGPEGGDVDRFLKRAGAVGPETFIALERSDGSWKERITRLHRSILRFDASEGLLTEAVRDPLTWRFYESLDNLRRSKKVSNLTDAAVLSHLGSYIRQTESTPGSPLVRFYSHGWVIPRAVHGDLAEAISYRVPTEFQAARWWKPGLILRSTDYYILRACFEALRFKQLRVRGGGLEAPAVSLADLEKLSEQLGEILAGNDPRMLRRAGEIPIGGRSLGEVVVELEKLSFMHTVLSRYQLPESLVSIVEGLADVWRFMGGRRAQVRLREEIVADATAVTEALEAKVGGLRSWFSLFSRVEKSAKKVAQSSGKESVPDINRDLGLVRWGALLEKKHEKELSEFYLSLMGRGEHEVARAVAQLVAWVAEVDSTSACVAVTVVLWTLSLFEDVVEVINQFENREPVNFDVALVIIRTAARLRTGVEFSEAEKMQHVHALEQMVGSSASTLRGRMLIGLGYVSFYIYLAEAECAAESAISWAERSFRYGEQAQELLAEDELGLAFAINHCAYVGSHCGIRAEATERYLEIVASFVDSAVWNYRFADTLAYQELRRAMAFWEQVAASGVEDEREELRREGCNACFRAGELLAGAWPNFGDVEIPEHVRIAKSLERRLGCHFRGIPTRRLEDRGGREGDQAKEEALKSGPERFS